MKRFVLVILLLCVLLLCPTLAFAQGYQLQFTTNAQHNAIEHGVPVISSYELVLTSTSAGGATGTQNLGKPTPVNNVVTTNVNEFVSKMPAGNYNVVVRAIGPGGTTPSAAVPFATIISVPSAVTVTGISRVELSGQSQTPTLSKSPSQPVQIKK